MKVVLIFDHFGPYHLARAKAAAEVMDVACIELHAKSRSYGWEVAREGGGPELTSLPDVGVRGRSERRMLEPHLAAALGGAAPDVVAINGWGDFMSLESLRWCVRNGVPAIVMSESTAWDESRAGCREFLKRRVIRMFLAGLVGGTPQKEYLVKLGMSAANVEIGYDAVDNNFFAAETERWRAADGEVRKPYFLASARFVAKKNLKCLVAAYAEYRKSFSLGKGLWGLVLLGDGELRGELERQMEGLGLEVREGAPWEADFGGEGVLWLPGFRQVGELPRFYAGAGCFVHASMTEQWGLVVNEAMASGLPVIVSERCGCARDLVEAGVNGFCFDPGKPGELAKLMLDVAGPEFPRRDFGDASRRIIGEFGPRRFALGLRAAANTAVRRGAPRASWLDRAVLDLLCHR